MNQQQPPYWQQHSSTMSEPVYEGGDTRHPPDPPSKGTTRPAWMRYGSTALVALLAGFAIGASDNTAEERLDLVRTESKAALETAEGHAAELEDELVTIEEEVDEANLRADEAEDATASLDRRESMLDKRASALDTREAKLDRREKDQREPPTSSGGGNVLTGNGSKTVTLNTSGGTLQWTNDGDLFQLWSDDMDIFVNSQGSSGTTEVPSGQHRLTVNALGNWTIRVP